MSQLKYYDTGSSSWLPVLAGAQGVQGPAGAQGAQGVAIGSASVNTWRKVAAGGETSLSGTDDFTTSLSYTAGAEQVFINGILLIRGTDYTATDGSTVTSLVALQAGDVAVVMSHNSFAVANAVPLSTVTTAGDLILGTGASTVSRLGIGTVGLALVSNGTTATWSSVVPWTSAAIAANTTLVSRYQYFVTTSSAWTLTLPASPAQGDEIRIFDASGSAATNNITVTPGATLFIHGSNQTLVMNVAYGAVTLVYTGSTYGWKVS